VIAHGRALKVFVYSEPADLRNGYDGLWQLVINKIKADPMSGDLYVFLSKNRRRAKVLYWDGTGVCLHCKRIEQGHFSAPWKCAKSARLTITLSELGLLLDGSDILPFVPLAPPEFFLKKGVI